MHSVVARWPSVVSRYIVQIAARQKVKLCFKDASALAVQREGLLRSS